MLLLPRIIICPKVIRTMKKLKENRTTVIPGEALANGKDARPGTGVYEENNQIYSQFLGTVEYRNNKVRVKPMKGRYFPREGDSVIAVVSQVTYSNWILDINSPYEAVMPIGEAVDEYIDLSEDDISDYYDVGDVVIAKIQKVTKSKDMQVGMKDRRSRKIKGGMIIEVPPTKVPRIIGKKGSMVNMIKDKTNCTIVVGQNGRTWIRGENEGLAAQACKKVARDAQQRGLTDKIEKWLDEQLEEREEGDR